MGRITEGAKGHGLPGEYLENTLMKVKVQE
jgi:hypothetical protein